MLGKTRDAVIVVLLTILFAAGLKSCIVDAFRIPTESMRSTLLPGDFVLVNKFMYGAKTPSSILYIHIPSFQFPKLKQINRGDVIVFEFPGEPDEVIQVRHQYLVKRCVGLPRDTVAVHNGIVLVNGYEFPVRYKQPVNEFTPTVVPFKGMTVDLNEHSFNQWKVFIRREGHAVELRGQKIFVDGVERSYYHVEKNYYFALGDNLNNSYDSRFWGAIPEENIVGQAMMIYWSKDSTGVRWKRMGTMIR